MTFALEAKISNTNWGIGGEILNIAIQLYRKSDTAAGILFGSDGHHGTATTINTKLHSGQSYANAVYDWYRQNGGKELSQKAKFGLAARWAAHGALDLVALRHMAKVHFIAENPRFRNVVKMGIAGNLFNFRKLVGDGTGDPVGGDYGGFHDNRSS